MVDGWVSLGCRSRRLDDLGRLDDRSRLSCWLVKTEVGVTSRTFESKSRRVLPGWNTTLAGRLQSRDRSFLLGSRDRLKVVSYFLATNTEATYSIRRSELGLSVDCYFTRRRDFLPNRAALSFR